MRTLAWSLALFVALTSVVAQAQEPEKVDRKRRAPEKERVDPRRDERGRDERVRDDRRPIRDPRGPNRPVRPRPPQQDDGSDTPPPSTATPRPAPFPAEGFVDLPFADPAISDWYYDDSVLRCPSALVCPLDPLDDYYAWMLSAQTTIPYREFAELRTEGWTWDDVLFELGVEPWEAYAAVGAADPDSLDEAALSDETLRDLALSHTAGIDLPRFRCEEPVEVAGFVNEDIRRDPKEFPFDDTVASLVAERIADETGWCVDELLDARRLLGSWGRAAKRLYLSPFLFESSFGIPLQIDQVGPRRLARYPSEAEIRYVADVGNWPEHARR